MLSALRQQTSAETENGKRLAPNGVHPIDLVPKVYLDVPEAIWPLAARSLLAHLIHLVERDLAHTDGTKYWADLDEK